MSASFPRPSSQITAATPERSWRCPRFAWRSALVALSLVACGGPQGADVEEVVTASESAMSETSETDEASTPRPLDWEYDVRHYEIGITIDPETTEFSGVVAMYATPRERALRCVSLHAAPTLGVSDVTIGVEPDVAAATVERDGDILTACVPRELVQGSEFVLHASFAGTAEPRNQLGIFHRPSERSELPMFFTQFEPQGARRAFPCYDEPYDKATSQVTLRSDSRYTLLSNGQLVSRSDYFSGHADAVWRNDDPISTYLITFVAAEMETLTGEYTRPDGSTIPLTIYTEPGRSADAEYAMYALRRSMEFFEQIYGLPYPWDSYGIVAVPGFAYGGMENKGLTNIGASQVYLGEYSPDTARYGIFGVIAHELAHEWFGNLVTMEWWSDIWLNEGFASYMADLAFSAEFGEVLNKAWEFVGLHTWYMDVERGPFAHAIVPESYASPDELFDAISYTKGQKVIEMLHRRIGDDAFRAGLMAYLEAYSLDNASTGDFFAAMQQFTEIPLDDFVSSWLYGVGFPEVQVTPTWDAEERQLALRFEQAASNGGDSLFVFDIPFAVLGATDTDEPYEITDSVTMTDTATTTSLSLPAHPEIISLNRNNVALAEISVTGRGLDGLGTQAAGDTDPIGRLAAFHEIVERLAAREPAEEDPMEAPIEASAWWGIESLLTDDEPALRQVALGRIGGDRIPEWLRAALCQRAYPLIAAQLQAIDPTTDDLIEIGIITSSLRALSFVPDPPTGEGEIDRAALFRTYATEHGVNYATTVAAALLRIGAPGRFELLDELLARYDEAPPVRRALLGALASTPDPEIFSRLRAVMANPELVGSQDIRAIGAIVGSLLRGNQALAYSEEGTSFLLEVAIAHLDQPGVVARLIRGMQRVESRSAAEQQRVVALLDALAPEAEAADDTEAVLAAIGALRARLAPEAPDGADEAGADVEADADDEAGVTNDGTPSAE